MDIPTSTRYSGFKYNTVFLDFKLQRYKPLATKLWCTNWPSEEICCPVKYTAAKINHNICPTQTEVPIMTMMFPVCTPICWAWLLSIPVDYTGKRPMDCEF